MITARATLNMPKAYAWFYFGTLFGMLIAVGLLIASDSVIVPRDWYEKHNTQDYSAEVNVVAPKVE